MEDSSLWGRLARPDVARGLPKAPEGTGACPDESIHVRRGNTKVYRGITEVVGLDLTPRPTPEAFC